MVYQGLSEPTNQPTLAVATDQRSTLVSQHQTPGFLAFHQLSLLSQEPYTFCLSVHKKSDMGKTRGTIVMLNSSEALSLPDSPTPCRA